VPSSLFAAGPLDNEFEAVSASLKVPFYKTFFRVTVPVCLPAILDIGRYLFINAMVTISAVVFLYSPDTKLASLAILNLDDAGEIGPAAARELSDMGISTGDHVHCISTLWCGICRLCRNGNEHLCVRGELMGFDYQGAYAELVSIPQIALKNLFTIPESLSDEEATFADPLSDAICGHKDIGIGLDETVAVIGAGPVGTAHAAISRCLVYTSDAADDLLRVDLGCRRLITKTKNDN